MSAPASISVVVPVWNGEALLRRLLETVQAQTLQPMEILVVDNGSTDSAPEVARRAGARVIGMGRNAGFAAAVNCGIGEATGDLVAVLNSDVELDPEYFAILEERLHQTEAWFASGKILRADDPTRLDGTFDVVCRGGTAYRVGHMQIDSEAYAKERAVWSVPWTAALFRRELFEETAGLDERFESYLEDVEFGLRCVRMGLAGLYVPKAAARHRGSATWGAWHGEIVRRISRNQVYLLALHFPKPFSWPVCVAHLLWGCLALRHGRGWAWATGKVQGLWGWKSIGSRDLGGAGQLEAFAGESERLIREVQMPAGPDWYWRMYFRLTGGGGR